MFAGAFYRHIFNEESINHAFKMAKLLVEGNAELAEVRPILELEALQSNKSFIPEEEKFLLLPKNYAHHDRTPFHEVTKGEISIEEPKYPKTNIPSKPQTFRGRSKEIHKITNTILNNRYVTISGVGGIGKTTTAVEVARWFYLRGHFPDCIFLIDLRGGDSASRILNLVGSCFGLQFDEIKDLARYLSDKTVLLILDNIEDILINDEKETRKLINCLLKFSSKTKLLLTSQRPVGGVLHEPERQVRLGVLDKLESANLFFTTSKRLMSSDELQSESFETLLEILGGHPLSIVLMARQLAESTSIEELISRLKAQKAKAIIVKGISDRDAEHGESFIASILSSYNSLDDNSKLLFSILSMLPAGGPRFVLEKISGSEIWEQAQKLYDSSLAEITSNNCTLLSPVRLFAETKLSEKTRNMYGPRIVKLLGRIAMELYNKIPSETSFISRTYFAVHEPNFRYALDLPFDDNFSKNERSDLGLLIVGLLRLNDLTCRSEENRKLETTILNRLRKIKDTKSLSEALFAISENEYKLSNTETAKSRLEESIVLFQENGDKEGEAYAFELMGRIILHSGNAQSASPFFEKALKLSQEIGNDNCEANAALQLGLVSYRTGELKSAESLVEDALKAYKSLGNQLGEANSLRYLGQIALSRGEKKKAKTFFSSSAEIYRKIGNILGLANALRYLGNLHLESSEPDDAAHYLTEALKLYQEVGNKQGKGSTFHLLGRLALLAGDIKAAKDHFVDSLNISKSIQDNLCEANAHSSLGEIALLMYDKKSARIQFEHALALFSKIGYTPAIEYIKQVLKQLRDS